MPILYNYFYCSNSGIRTPRNSCKLLTRLTLPPSLRRRNGPRTQSSTSAALDSPDKASDVQPKAPSCSLLKAPAQAPAFWEPKTDLQAFEVITRVSETRTLQETSSDLVPKRPTRNVKETTGRRLSVGPWFETSATFQAAESCRSLPKRSRRDKISQTR